MGFRLANVDGRAALVVGDGYLDLETASGGVFGPDPMAAIGRSAELSALADTLVGQPPTGTGCARAPTPQLLRHRPELPEPCR